MSADAEVAKGEIVRAGAFIVHVKHFHGNGLDVFRLNLGYFNPGAEDFGCLCKCENRYESKSKGKNEFFHIMIGISYHLFMAKIIKKILYLCL